MESRDTDSTGGRAPLIALALCIGVLLVWTVEHLVSNQKSELQFAPDWLPLVAAAVAIAGVAPWGALRREWLRTRAALRWAGLLLMVWAANGLPFDLLGLAGLLGHRTASGELVLSSFYSPGTPARVFALAAAIVLARIVLSRPAIPAAGHVAAWYGYAAFVLALPYPLLRIHWAMGGMLGLDRPGAAGEGWEPVLIAIPWMMAAALSLLLVPTRSLLPRRLLLLGGWTATLIVAMIGPAAFWSIARAVLEGTESGIEGMQFWVPALFYISWFLWAIAGAAATRSYQIRSATLPPSATAP